ncbi:MAG: M23 family metallopeptidase [Reinekea forsetii]|jgi:murein DD-endopeptidase MepM/ murein hydrolase activator NlpD|uniref:Peptidase, M23 family n=1 Tax=Reinekea forsetii TaxID=1336806 RepID=A0A2K8KST6_9GAMM|nr:MULTISPECIES: M23 family metallopeptidase [Reinekea]ATX77788.1 peptidase, M23 family [Reinekea forsetii]MDO7634580.1 M23 family metallopeptidase [Porticoccaceae bacterium]MDO7675175.1 M23 family metallopeptidase [Reinekea forsetii]
MKIILVSSKHGRSTMVSVWMLVPVLFVLVSTITGAGYLGYQYLRPIQSDIVDQNASLIWLDRIENQAAQVEKTRVYTEEQINALRIRLAQLQARLTRLDALGERLVDVASLDKGEFDFSVPPAVGGPESEFVDYQAPDFVNILDELANQIDNREQQLRVLNSLLGDRKIQNETFVAGRPIKRGWMSSRYGYRNDPFSGNLAWHEGVDFAGKNGSDIVSVASGVVTWAGTRSGYGKLVEINHGNGFVTRYAHCDEILVELGDVVTKGDIISLMGSTGRSTGPHVHFEVLFNGKAVDPAKYINRVARF